MADTEPNERFTLYTRGNVGEVFPRVMSALTGSLIGDAVARGQTDVLVEMGVLRPHEVTGPSVGTGVFGGYLYMNGSAMRLFGVRMPGLSPADADVQVMGDVTDLPPYRPAKGDRSLVASLALSRYVARLLRSPDLPTLDEARADAQAWLASMPDLGSATDDAVAVVADDLPAPPGGEHEAALAVQRRRRSAPGPARPPPGPPGDPARPGQPDRQRDRRRRLRPAGPAAVGTRSDGVDRRHADEDVRRRARGDRRSHRAHGAGSGRRRLPRRPRTSRQRRVRAGHAVLGDGPDPDLCGDRPAAARAGRSGPDRRRRPSRRRRGRRAGRGPRRAATPPAVVRTTLRDGRPTGLDRPRASQGHPRAREPGRPSRAPRAGPAGGGAWRPSRRASPSASPSASWPTTSPTRAPSPR